MSELVIPEACDAVHAEKHREIGESRREQANRIAAALQDDHEHYMQSREILISNRFLPAGRVQTGAGSLRNVTLYNCFVMPTFHDSFTHGPTLEELVNTKNHEFPAVCITDMVKLAAQTMRQGGGVGYDFSTLRPGGDVIKGVQSVTDGPMAFMPMFDTTCRATSSAGNRRGAQMATMRVDHPDIERFIMAKQVSDQSIPYELRPLRGFNMSVMITDEFMEAVASGSTFRLKFNGVKYREVDAVALWDRIMRGTFDWAEPGVIFIDTVNRMNNLWYCEKIAATNPCGEQPLPPYGACLLGSINLPTYLVKNADGSFSFDADQLQEDIPAIHRMMDNVVDRSRYPLEEQRTEAKNKRRMGIGVTGLANCLEALGHPYGSPGFLKKEDELLQFINRRLYISSAMLAKEKGSFPLYDEDKYLSSEFIETLDDDVRDLIKVYGIRNSHLTSIAPTGSISFGAGNVSPGIEPPFGYWNSRRVKGKEGDRVVEVQDYGVRVLGVKGKICEEVTPKEHVDVLITAQRNVDSAVSKTCNLPSSILYDDFKSVYWMAYDGGAKGCTTYRPNGAYDSVVSNLVKDEDQQEACGFNPLTGEKTGPCAED